MLSISHHGIGSRRLDPKRLNQSVARKVEKKPVCSGKMAERVQKNLTIWTIIKFL